MTNGNDAGGLTLKERLVRIETAIDALVTAVNALQIKTSNVQTRLATAGSIVAVTVSLIAGYTVWQDEGAQTQSRTELCQYIQHKDNAARQTELESTRLVFKSFKELVNTPEKAQLVYEQNRNDYEALRSQQPSFCPLYDVPPFPSLTEFKD